MEENKKILFGFFKPTIKFFVNLGVIVGILIGLFAFDEFLDNKIEEKINDPEYIRKVARNVRPSIIFNAEEVILNDLGGMQFIEHIHIPKESIGNNFPYAIIISPIKYLDRIPLLESVDSTYFTYKTKRINSFDIEYTLDRHGFIDTLAEPARFRLEILP